MADDILLKLGHKIKYERVKNKLSQAQLAEKSDLSTNAVSLIELGVSNVKFTNLYAIASAFNMSLVEFLDFKL